MTAAVGQDEAKVDFEKEIKPIFSKLTPDEVAKIKKWIEQGASYHSAEKIEPVLSGMIKGGNSVRESVLRNSNGVLKDMKVYRDGKKNGIVFKYTYADDVTVDASRLTSKKIKGMMVPQLQGDKNVQDALNLDIYVKIVYQSAEGKVYGQATITKADFAKINED